MAFMRGFAVTAAVLCLISSAVGAQETGSPTSGELSQILQNQQDLEHRLDELERAIDDIAWYHRVGDIALVDKWRITGPPDANPKNPTAPGATNPIKFFTYTFIPRDRKPNEKLPLLVFPHGGVHARFDSNYSYHIVRELVQQGYVVVAPEYRGSTGYGKGFYQLIDYGGREVDDAQAAKDWALATFDFVDRDRVGLVGWSHGGLIVLMLAFNYPKDYRCVYAGVPVSDLIMRLGYHDKDYEELFSAEYHVGKTVRQDIAEYKRRSPVWHVEKLSIPLLIHTNTNDEDVNVIEVEHLIQALKAAGKDFQYKIFQDAPGGHSFDRLDTPEAFKIRKDIYAFLARYLKPPRALP